MTRRGVSNRPSRSGSSPAKAISVRTAVSACSREGRGLTGVGAARTWSDKVCLGQGLTLELLFGASMTGLSVRPARRAGSVTGVAASAAGKPGGWTAHSLAHGSVEPCPAPETLLAPGVQPYI